MPRVLHQYIQQWCQEHGWTDLFVEQRQFWAFPPGSVLPVPVPTHALEGFYSEREMSPHVCLLSLSSIGLSLLSVFLTVRTLSPVPLLAAFGCCAIAAALLEEERL
ncbi:hypothetical protein [Altericista sp. CCNU0014]|uniref:slr1957 family protein n=1 Tax=Altericista sp. CCNU0014 TaxID=3082949 RepID=UPI00384ADBA9